METWIVEGGEPLCGEVNVTGAKNSITKLMVASMLTGEPCTFFNAPNIGDTYITQEICEALGSTLAWQEKNQLLAHTPTMTTSEIPLELGNRNRLAIMMMGPLLHRTGKAVIPAAAGGDRIGPRPVNFHLQGIEKLGAHVEIGDGKYTIQADKLKGTEFILPFPSVTSTENLIICATMAEGRTTIRNAAVEPEVIDLVMFLQKMGAIIDYKVDRTIVVEGVKELFGTNHRLIPDRNVGVSLAVAAVATGGDVFVHGARQTDLLAFLNMLRRVGGKFDIENDGIRFFQDQPLKAITLETSVHPGFMTDWQPPFVLLLTQAEGLSVVHETVFEDRFGYVSELQKMGAEIALYDSCLGGRECRFHSSNYRHSCVIKGPADLKAAQITVPDLRAGFVYLIVAIMADGKSVIEGVEHITRGYEDLQENMIKLGARITPQ